MKHWYKYRSRDGKVRGYCPAKSKQEVARFAGYPLKELIVKKVIYDGEEFVNGN